LRATTYRSLIASAVTIAVIAFTGQAAQAAPEAAADGPQTTIGAVAPSVLTDVAPVDTTASATNAVDTTVAGADITIPVDPTDPIAFTAAQSSTIEVGLPYASRSDDAQSTQEGVVEFENDLGFSSVPVVKQNGSLQIATTISDQSAPQRYAYPVTLPDGGSIHVDEYGGAYVLAADATTLIATVDPAWATDANGDPVPTHFEVEGTTLVQVVEHRAAGVAYPVVADPWWGLQYTVSSTSANRLSALLYGGAGVAGIVAAICSGTIVGLPCGAAVGIAAGLLAIGGAALSWCNAKGKGIHINLFWTGLITCTSR
jgi:hypothetical protein